MRYRWPSVFSLGSWSTRIRAGFLVPRPTQEPRHGDSRDSDTGLSPSPAALSGAFSFPQVFSQLRGTSPRGPATPLKRFGLLPVRSPLLGESLLISFPGLLRWFTSPSAASAAYFIQLFGWRNRFRRVAPFGNPGIKGRSLLPLDFRGLPRPSSPDGPKASAPGLLSLGHIAPSARRSIKNGTGRPSSSLLVCLPFPRRVKERIGDKGI